MDLISDKSWTVA